MGWEAAERPGDLLYQMGQESSSSVLKMPPLKAGRAIVHTSMDVEAVLNLHVYMLTWHLDSTASEEVG